MAEDKLTMKTFLIILGVLIGVLTTIFGYVFAGTANIDQKCNDHINSHATISEQLGIIITDITWIKKNIEEIKLKIKK